MRVVVGVSPDDSGSDAVALGAVLTRLFGGSLVLAHVHPPTIDYPSMGHVDAEWATFLQQRADATLDRAESQLAVDWGIVDVERVVTQSATVSRGLRAVAEDLDAGVLVLGPDTGGRDGHLALGSIAHALLHGGMTAVALAPEGYRETSPERIERLVVGFADTPDARVSVNAALDIAARTQVAVELLTVVIRTTRIVGARVGRDPERAVMASLIERESAAQAEVVRAYGESLGGTVISGDTADQAMARFDWRSGDMFVVGSSRLAALRRVFMGDTTHKILRACTVPAIVLPRSPDELVGEKTSQEGAPA